MKTRGKIYPSRSLILRVDCGTASDTDNSYDLSTTMTGEPVIESKRTGKYFILGWQDIVDMAIESGIDIEEQEVAA